MHDIRVKRIANHGRPEEHFIRLRDHCEQASGMKSARVTLVTTMWGEIKTGPASEKAASTLKELSRSWMDRLPGSEVKVYETCNAPSAWDILLHVLGQTECVPVMK